MKIKVGDKVMCKGGFGTLAPQKVTVVGIELCYNDPKYGDSVDEIHLSDKNRSVFDLDNGHWAYGRQIEPIT